MKATARELLGLLALVAAVGAAQQWWTGRQDAALGAQVAALARPGDIRMLSSDNCAICGAARAWFTANRVPYTECSIERDRACCADFEATAAPGTPVLLVRGQALTGFSPSRLLAVLGLPAGAS